MSEVETTISKDEGNRFQWARHLFYRKEGQKETLDTKRLTHLMLIAFGVTAIAILLRDPEDKRQKSVEDVMSYSPSQVMDIPAYSQAMGVSTNIEGETPKRRKSILQGPELVLRPRVKLPPGLIFKAKLASGASNGPVRAEVVEAPVLNGENPIEEGTVIIGTGMSTEERLFISFNQLVLKDGSVDALKAQAFDSNDKIVGLKGSKVGNYALKLAGGMGLNFAGGFSEGLQDTEVQGGVAVKKSTLSNALLHGSAMAALEQSKEMMSSLKNSVPIIEVEAGTEVMIVTE